MPSGGTVLGFEPRLSDDWDLACSWHCNALAAKFVTRTGLKPNAFGMIDDFGTAQEFSRVIAREGLGEPGLWLPWLVVDYTSEIDALL